MCLIELPSELFLVGCKKLRLNNNCLRALPSEIAQLTSVEQLWV